MFMITLGFGYTFACMDEWMESLGILLGNHVDSWNCTTHTYFNNRGEGSVRYL